MAKSIFTVLQSSEKQVVTHTLLTLLILNPNVAVARDPF